MTSRTVLVTRPAERASRLAGLLAARAIGSVEVPTIAIDAEPFAAGVDAMVERLAGADWLVLTSANGAEALAMCLQRTGHRLPHGTRVAAVGPATAAALRRAGIAVDHVPAEFLTVAVADGLGDVHGRRIVLARADAATPQLREALEEREAVVEEVAAYRIVEGPPAMHGALHAALCRPLDGIAFTSGSTVRGLMRLASPTDRERARTLSALCIGPVTAEVARGAGLDVAVVANEHTAAGLAGAIRTYFQGVSQ